MKVSAPKEYHLNETRVAIVPESIGKLIKLGYSVEVEAQAGMAAGISDEDYKKAGANIVATAAELYASADILLKVHRPGQHPSGKHELEMMKSGSLLIGFFYSLNNPDLAKLAAQKNISVLSMDAVPRITKAQRMDALSSQTNLAGYKAVILAANHLGKIFPLMMTAAGTIPPAKVVILGAGVAGLQAIATAKRLGAVVEVSDVRPAVKEQVESLGGKFIELPKGESLEGAGGYSKEASEEFLKKQKDLLRKHSVEADCVITTALVPGKKAPVLVTREMVDGMKSGAVIVDMAAEQGGNCEYTQPGKIVNQKGVTIIGEVNLVSFLGGAASQLYSRNIFALIEYLNKEGKVVLDLEDEIVKGSLIVHNGQVVHEATKSLIG